MHGKDPLDGLKLHNHPVPAEKVSSVTVIDRQIFVTNWNQALPVHRQTPLFQFVKQASLVGAFEEPRPESGMDLHRRRDDRVSNFIFCHLRALCESSASSALKFSQSGRNSRTLARSW